MQLYRPNPVLEFLRKHRFHLFLVGLCVCSLGLTGWGLYAVFVVPDVPDAEKASVEEINGFVASGDFRSMSTKERGDYADKIFARMRSMSPEERQEARESLRSMGLHKRETRKNMRDFWMSFVIKRAEEYAELSPDEKTAYIDRWLNIAMAMGRGRMGRRPGGQGGENGRPHHQPGPPPVDRMLRAMSDFTSNTTAKQRAEVLTLAGDAMKRARERFGDDPRWQGRSGGSGGR